MSTATELASSGLSQTRNHLLRVGGLNYLGRGCGGVGGLGQAIKAVVIEVVARGTAEGQGGGGSEESRRDRGLRFGQRRESGATANPSPTRPTTVPHSTHA